MNAYLRWLRTQWPTSTTMLEIPIYLLVVGAMWLVTIYSYVYAQRHVHVMEALSVMTGPRVTMMEFRAVTGAWPRSNAEAGFSDAMFKGGERGLYRVNSIEIREGGAMDVGFARGALKGKILSIRAREGQSSGLPIEWICGHALPLPGTIAATDQTTLSDDDLPSPCRAHK
jgi:Pilin (bacterial filament)